jgi:hypothetical protein
VHGSQQRLRMLLGVTLAHRELRLQLGGLPPSLSDQVVERACIENIIGRTNA